MKNFLKFPPILIVILIIIGCKTEHESVLEPYSALEHCTGDSTHKYSVYIPSRNSGCINMPLLVVLDPHGSGNYAINHLIQVAEKYKCILVASHLVRNNYAGFIPAIEMLIRDAQLKYTSGDKIYLAGFSGSARMALTYAQYHKVEGVLACGALATADQIAVIKSRVFAVAGFADFNFPEVASFILTRESKPVNLNIELTGELHQWPSQNDITRIFGNLLISSIDNKSVCIEVKESLKLLADDYKKHIDSLYDNNMLINCALACENILKVKNIPLKQYFIEFQKKVDQDARKSVELTSLQKSLQFEFKVRDAYYNALKVRDRLWWSHELADLDSLISSGNDIMTRNAYRRIKAFLGIVCYSITNNALRAGDLSAANKTLEVYRLVEPENADMFYFSALYALKTNDEKSVKSNLLHAISYGFSDTVLLKSDFPGSILNEISAE